MMKLHSRLLRAPALAGLIIMLITCNQNVPFVDLNSRSSTGGGGGRKPQSPTDLILTPVSEFQIDATWIDNADNEEGYRLYWSTEELRPSSPNHDTMMPNVTMYSIRELEPNTRYYVWVETYNEFGSSDVLPPPEEPVLTKMAARTGPDRPAFVSLQAVSEAQIDLEWTDSANESGYRVYRSNTATRPALPEDDLPANRTRYQMTGLDPDTLYYFWLEAYNSSGSAVTNAELGTSRATSPPAAPSIISAILSGTRTSVELTWVDNADNEVGYKVYWATRDVKPTDPQFTGNTADMDIYRVTGLSWGIYHFWVEAYNSAGAMDERSDEIATGKIGYVAMLSSPSYGLSGRVVIINDTTLRFENFSYNGAGPGAYIRLGTGPNSFPLEVGSRLPAYNNDTFDVMLPSGESMSDYTWVQIWCKPFRVNFAKDDFEPP